MRRALSFAMALILLLALTIPALAAETETTTPKLTLSVDTDKVSPGQEVVVTLALDQALSGLNNYQFNVLYDAARFELTGSTVGAAPTVVSAPREDEQGKGDCITVSGLSTEGQAVSLSAGTVATLTFKALDAAELGETEFAVSVQALPSYADHTVSVDLTVVNDAKVTLEEKPDVIPGDFNGDGMLKINDYLQSLYACKTRRALTEQEQAAADTNNDERINVSEYLKVLYLVKTKTIN